VQTKKKLVCVLACRNQGSRLYGKPLQNLDIKKNVRIIDYIIKNIKKIKVIEDIVLAVSNEQDNLEYINIAKKNKIKIIFGNEFNVLTRLIKGCESVNGSDVFRITSESPFIFDEQKIIKKSWINHQNNNVDFTFTPDQVIDGCGYEIINLSALKLSHKNGKKRHRSEFCSLYIRQNKNKFINSEVKVPNYLLRKDLRLTVDYPEDLILCRQIYKKLKNDKLKKIIKFIDKNKNLKKLCKNILLNEI
jgi:spore coat polysaccharide biosynthesis protein SpsF